MDENVTLKYGKTTVEIPVRNAKSIEYIYEKPMPEIDDLEAEFERSITENVTGKSFYDIFSKDDKVTIIISDLTRFWMRQDLICEMLLKRLEKIGVDDGNVAVVVALGTHRKLSEDELKRVSSEYVYSRVSVTNHDCDADNLVYVGTTSYGTEVNVNPLAVGRKVIVVSGTVHHLMAGYGGGRKSILPGVASRETIRHNHSMALDPIEPHSSMLIGSGKLVTNPINNDMLEAAHMVNPCFGINIVVNSKSKHCGLFCGDFDRAHAKSCKFCQDNYGLAIDHEADIVIASCGGFPKDLNLYQGVKSLLNGANAMKKGGTFIFLAECPEGGGAKDFFDWTKPLSQGRLDEALRESFTIAGYIFYASCESIRKADKFFMYSSIDPSLVADMKLDAYSDMSLLLRNVDFSGKSVYIIPNGGGVLPQTKDKNKMLNDELSK